MRKNTNHKLMKLPKKYEAGFITKLDQRTETFLLLNTAYQEVLSDLGGVEMLSHTKQCLVERFIFLEFMMRKWELRLVRKPKKNAHLISRWIQAINSLNGLARILGLERRAKKITSLQAYVKDKE